MREDVPDRWDLIVSAPWLGEDKRAGVSYLVAQIKSRLGEDDLVNLSRIVLIDPKDVAVQNLNRAIQVEHGNFFGLPIKHAFIVTSKRPPTASKSRSALYRT